MGVFRVLGFRVTRMGELSGGKEWVAGWPGGLASKTMGSGHARQGTLALMLQRRQA